MYTQYFGLIDPPFSIAPNPQYLYMSDRHREALAHLLYGVNSDGGFVLLTGEVGTGKTTVCRCLLQELPENVDTAFILNPKLTTTELLQTICDDLDIVYQVNDSIKLLVDKLNAYLLNAHANNRKTVLIVDEAQNLAIDVLEQLRLLTNLETNQRKLVQIILIGQPELLSILARKELRQLSQRITARFHLDALSRNEVVAYVHHRLAVAGVKGTLFPMHVFKKIYKLSGGIPRLINLICDRSLLGTYSQNGLQVTSAIVDQAAEEIFGRQRRWATNTTAVLAGIILTVSVATIGWNISTNLQTAKSPIASTAKSLPDHKPVTTGRLADTIPAAVNGAVTEAITGADAAPEETDAIGIVLQAVSQTELEPIPDYENLDELLNRSYNQNSRTAFHDLLSIWGTEYAVDSTVSPCEAAIGAGLRCWHRLSSLRDIRHLDRPVILVVETPDGRTVHITMSQLASNGATLMINGSSHLVDTDEIHRYWRGEHSLLWRMPPSYQRPSKLGDQGVEIDWLEEQLNRIQNRPARTVRPLVFDEEMQYQVEQFQMSMGLVPDGVVGFQTWIHINSQIGLAIPYLVPRSEG